MAVKLAIIGGSGVYDPSLFQDLKNIKVSTPFGAHSSSIEVGEFMGKEVAFLNRHGKGHTIPPHLVNSRANIWALKELGVERIVGVCAVGSLKEEYKPGEIVIPDQFIDFTKKRDYTFYNGGQVFHISTADPFCPELRDLFFREAQALQIPVHQKGTYLCIEGPRFSTRAESKMFRQYADIIGMTLVPEAQLALELEMCYVSLAMVTDYDVWRETSVDAQEVIKTMGKNLESIKKILTAAIPKINSARTCPCKDALKNAEI
ncbi:MAG: 5'-deoxy-5'-methylthioadenosine phosphorylase [Parcubacteria group bacterium Athens1014_10]|nr:MAG: 5'-deoxy-5'-methylthioadenosine phosphorylase [Parcubacteria group bacterium Athens1014_10]TSD05181.1 MAG: 5'-deoxy-5'-methylthioadenosine phosphorylase [Parcubacteria group bacterium Athens0714_12]